LLIIIHLWFREKIEKILKIEEKFPPALVTILAGILVAFVFAFIFFGPGYIGNTLGSVSSSLLHPMGTDRLTLTVAENNQPYFDHWRGEFGLNFFWIFFFGSIFIFFEALNLVKVKNKILLTGAYFIMLLALIFSRHSSASTLNGVSALSRTVYFGGFILFGVVFLYVYLKDYYKNKEEFSKFSHFDKNFMLLLIWFFWMAISARGAMRLFMMLAQPAAILASAIAVRLPQEALKNKEDLSKIILWCGAALVIMLLVLSSVAFAQTTSNRARYTVPSYYNIQWQKAMLWVRENTDEGAVFSHWWDYGYWLQTIGERATVMDGGNSIGYWNHLFGRHVLTGQSELEALEFLYAHNVTYLLIDSTEIGKYTAYSSIGSDVDYDRYSWIPTFSLDEKQTQETKNETKYVYVGGTMLDQDFVYENQLYPQGRAAVGALIFGISEGTSEITQPEAVMIYGGKQERVPLRYLYVGDRLYDFQDPDALQACLYIIPRIDDTGVNNMGAALYLSERGMDALWVHLYLLKEGDYFRLAHSEQDVILEDLRNNYNLTINELALYRGNLLGPIKIWEVDYPEDIEFKPEYIETVFPDEELYLSRSA
jgi:asparagine N-glycosylation enzyme membrane subunit Stt3